MTPAAVHALVEQWRTVARSGVCNDPEQLLLCADELEQAQAADVAASCALEVEQALRGAGVADVRLWARPWYGGFGARYSVTLTLEQGMGEVHGDSLAGALAEAMRKAAEREANR